MSDTTVILHDGVAEQYAKVLERLKAAADAANIVGVDVPDDDAYAVLGQRRKVAADMAESFFLAWMALTVTNRNPDHDGPLHLYAEENDHQLSFGFRFERSGYSGGLIFWPQDTIDGDFNSPVIPGGRWQTHT